MLAVLHHNKWILLPKDQTLHSVPMVDHRLVNVGSICPRHYPGSPEVSGGRLRPWTMSDSVIPKLPQKQCQSQGTSSLSQYLKPPTITETFKRGPLCQKIILPHLNKVWISSNLISFQLHYFSLHGRLIDQCWGSHGIGLTISELSSDLHPSLNKGLLYVIIWY